MSRRSRNRNRPSSLIPRPHESSPFNPRAAAPPEAFEILGENEVAQFPVEVEVDVIRHPNGDVEVVPRRDEQGRMIPVRPPTRPPDNQVEVDFENTVSTRRNAVDRPPGFWKLRNGRFIEIRRMDDSHLANCIRMCERSSLSRGRRPFPAQGTAYLELLEERNRRTATQDILEFEERRRLIVQALNSGAAERLSDAGINPTPAAVNLLNSLTGRIPRVSDTEFRPIPVEVEEIGTTWSGTITQEIAPIPEPEPTHAPTTLSEGAPKRRIKT